MPVLGSKAENTCNALLCEELRKLGLQAFFEEHFLTQFGTSKPDIYLEYEKSKYFVEAKQTPRKLVDAVSKAYTYQKRLQIISPKAIFAVLHPDDCVGSSEAGVLLNVSPFYVGYRAKSLKDLARWIYSMITEPPVAEEINVSDAIKLLREAVSGVCDAFSKLEPKEVEDIFGGNIFFETILGIEEEEEIPIEHLRHAAAYLLVNQILFYQILAKEKKNLIRYREIDSDKLERPSQLFVDYFSKVLLEDYKPIFGFDIASKIKGVSALEAVKVTIHAINSLSPEALGHDILGKIFHNLIPFDLRKTIAAYYTNIQAGEILATLAIRSSEEHAIDPACGSGTLLVSAYRRKKELLEQTGKKFGFANHKRFIEEELTGIDIMPFAAHLAAIHLALQAPLYTTDFVRVAIQDSTSLKPNMTIAPAQQVLKEAFKQRKLDEAFHHEASKTKGRISKGVVSLSNGQSRPIPLNKVDLVIMNPPFTRFQRIPPSYKSKLTERFSESRYKECIHGQLGLHGYFLLLADRFLKQNGRLAAVLPVTTLSAKGFYGIQDLWFKNYSLEHIISCEGRSAFSENVRTREILLVAKKTKQAVDKVGVSILKVSPDSLTVAEALSLAKTFGELLEDKDIGDLVDSEKFLFRAMSQSELSKSKRGLFRAISLYRKELVEIYEELAKIYSKSRKAITFEDYLNSVSGKIHESPRGIERFGYYGLSLINGEERALKKHDFWVIKAKTTSDITVENRFSGVTFKIPLSSVTSNIRRYAGLKCMDISNCSDYVITKPFDGLKLLLQNSEIREEERQNALSNLKKGVWEEIVERNSGKVAMIYRANITAPMTHNVAFYSKQKLFFGGSFWRVDVDDDLQAKLLTVWLNSTLNLFQFLVERKETEGGWLWFDDYVLKEFLIPDLKNLSDGDKNGIITLLQKHGKTPLPSILSQLQNKHPIRKEIDETFLKILGMPESQIESFLERLYNILAFEFVKLQEVMGSGRESEE